MTEQAFLKILNQYNQNHIIEFYYSLSQEERDNFLMKTSRLDVSLALQLYNDMRAGKHAAQATSTISPPDVLCLPSSKDEKRVLKEAYAAGESLIRKQKVAVLIVAGGQGSRLGYDGPKGTYPISPVRNKTLFQLFTEQVLALSRRYQVTIPLLIMTSEENHKETVRFFQENHFFGLPAKRVHFFSQAMLPTITPEGELLLDDDGRYVTNPDGHGGSLKALYNSGFLKRLINEGYSELFYCQVDNPLVKIADPVFLGCHAMAASEASTKVVRRRDISEKVGLYVRIDNRDAIIEYNDIGEQYMSSLDGDGEILYWAGNTAIHIFSLDFIRRITGHGFALPYHCAKKTAEYIDHKGNRISREVWKFETFVFDAIPLAGKTCCMEVKREEEFAPVKNKEGADSPETARKAMISLYTGWLRDAGVEVDPNVKVEISPLFALDAGELLEKLKVGEWTEKKDVYLDIEGV